MDEAEATANADDVTSSSSKAAAQKNFLDPLNSVRKYLGCEGVRKLTMSASTSKNDVKAEKKAKKRKRSSGDDDDGDRSKKSKKRRKKEKKQKHQKKRKKRRASSSSSDDKDDDVDEEAAARQKAEKKAVLGKLRIERLERERKERERTEILLYGKSQSKKTVEEKQEERLKETRKYNNQFNPDMARQNKLDSNKKYWLE